MFSIIKDFIEERKEKRENRLKKEAFQIISSNPLVRHYWYFNEIYGNAGPYGGNYVEVKKEKKLYLCTLALDYIKETSSGTGGRIDTLIRKNIFSFILVETNPVFQKVDKEFTEWENAKNTELKNTLLNNLVKLEEELRKTDSSINEVKETIENKRKEIITYALKHQIKTNKNVKVNEEDDLEKLINKRKELMDKKTKWIDEINKIE